MVDIDDRYYKPSIWYMEMSGVWLSQKNWNRRTKYLLWCIIHCTLILPVVFRMIKELKNLTILLENIVILIFILANCMKYSIFYNNSRKLMNVYERMKADWRNITDASELLKLTEYNDTGRLLRIFYTAYLYLAWMIYTWMPFVPYVLNVMFPLKNATRPVIMPLQVDYIIFEQSKYHYWTCTHVSAVLFFEVAFLIGVDTYFVISVAHVTGLFGVICHRIKAAIKRKIVINGTTEMILNQDAFVRQKFKEVVILHLESIEYVHIVEETISTCYLVITVLSIVGLAIEGVRIFLIYEDKLELFRNVLVICGLCIHLLFINWIAQQIINSGENVFESAYFSEWYSLPPKTRKFIQIIMTRALCPIQLTAGKLIQLSMETYGMILRNITSYYTVFVSILI